MQLLPVAGRLGGWGEAQLRFETHLIVSCSEPPSQEMTRKAASCYFTWKAQPEKGTRGNRANVLEGHQAAACPHAD